MREVEDMSQDENWEKLLDFLEAQQQNGDMLTAQEQAQLVELRLLVAETSEAFMLYHQLNVDQKWNELRAQAEARHLIQPEIEKPAVMLWPRITVGIAAALALIVLGLYFFNYRNDVVVKQVQNDLVLNDVAPGKVGATLTLANGNKIRLADAANGELVRQAGISITKTADGQLVYGIASGQNTSSNDGSGSSDPELDSKSSYNTLSTAKGETYQVRLPDGSLVYLNAASSLTYAASLIERGKRVVRLRGEGYFEISKDKKHPFVVQTDNQQVEVLGTHFNVNSYDDDPVIKTTLLKGSVKVSTTDGNVVKLKPGEQSTLSKSGSLIVSEADTEMATAWKNNKFVFANEPIQNVMRMVERWYNVEIVYQGAMPVENFRGSVSRFDNVSKVLHMLESTGSVHLKVEGRRIYVSK